MRQETEVIQRRVQMVRKHKHLPGGFRLLAHPSRTVNTSRPVRAPILVPRRSSGREVTLGDAPRDGSESGFLQKKMFAETTNVFPGCFRRSARRVDMLREFHLALAGRGEVNGSNAPRDGKHRQCRCAARTSTVSSTSAPRFPSLGAFRWRPYFSSPHVPIESPRVARSDPEATGASYSRETKDGPFVPQMFVLRWRHLWKMLFVTRRWLRPSAPRLRPFSPVPGPVPSSSQIVSNRLGAVL